jgi:hypothetical protein
MGASTTYTGRQITTHMTNTISATISGLGKDAPKLVKTVNHVKKKKRNGDVEVKVENTYTIDIVPGCGPVYGDTDSVAWDSTVELNGVRGTIESHFNKLAKKHVVDVNAEGRELMFVRDVFTHTYVNGTIKCLPVKGLYRHKAKKQMFMVTTDDDIEVVITEDHSAMVLVDGKLVEKKPSELQQGEQCVCFDHGWLRTDHIASVKPYMYSEDSYVYDIIMEDDTKPWFFANGILVHNSNYFTMAGIVNNKEDAIAAADAIANVVNDSFQGFMQQAFNCTPGFDDLIKAAREIVARTGILQAKKKYMMAMVDKDGDPVEEGSEDELKTMGSDIKLSSTPEVIRKMLSDVVMAVLNEKPKAEIDEIIIKFREYLGRDKDDSTDDLIDPLDLSAIMSVNELEEYQAKWELIERQGRGKVSIPANVRAAINYNYLIKHLKLTDEPEIMSGGKVKLLWLMPNDFGFDNIAFPSDTDELPTWFHEVLEADMGLMELKLVDQKLQNIFDALDWSVPTFQSQLVGTLLDIDDATVDRKKAKARKPKIDVEKQQVVAGNLLDFD